MAHPRPFHFGLVAGHPTSRESWIAEARRVEAAGYSTLLLGDHISFGGPAPLLTLLSAADATTRLRFGTHILGVDFRNPLMLAQEVATFDLLSDGRLELGIGAGWLGLDYAALGIPFDSGGTRIGRLAEAVTLLKQLTGDEPVTFAGEHFQVRDAMLHVKPVQRPHPPLFIGGGSKRILALAGREADIVGLNPKTTPAGQLDVATVTPEATMQKIHWMREAAGPRFEQIELNLLVNRIVVTNDRRRGLEEVAAWLAGFPSTIVTNNQVSPEVLLQSPHFLVGSIEQIVADLQERRERYGISYISMFVDPEARAQVDRIIEGLSGT